MARRFPTIPAVKNPAIGACEMKAPELRALPAFMRLESSLMPWRRSITLMFKHHPNGMRALPVNISLRFALS
jgi:hypothetical protein